jgi:hypothetical protein
MHEYIINLLPRLKTLGRTLNQIEIFVDKEWLLLDAKTNNSHGYTFLRDKRLIVSFNNHNKIGHWGLLPNRKLLIEFPNEAPLIFENAFLNDAVIVLKKNGVNNQPFILFDKMQIPDANVFKYFNRLLESPERKELPEGELGIIICFVTFLIILIVLLVHR